MIIPACAGIAMSSFSCVGIAIGVGIAIAVGICVPSAATLIIITPWFTGIVPGIIGVGIAIIPWLV